MRRSNKQRPVSVKHVALSLPKRAWRTIMWREGASSPLTSRFARVRVRAAHRDYNLTASRPEEWLLIEWPNGEKAFSPDGRTALSTSGDRTIKAWDVSGGHLLWNFDDPDLDGVYSIALSPDGRTLLSGSEFRNFMLVDVASGHLLRFFNGGQARSVAFSPDGRSALWGDHYGTIRLWDVSGANTLWGRIRWSITKAPAPKAFRGHASRVNSVAFSPDGLRILSSGDGSLRLWGVATGRRLVTLLSFDDESWLAITPEGFYDSSSPQDVQNFGVVRGLDVCSDDKVYNTLYRPDLVREKLAGDPDGKVKAAAAQLDLDKACFGSEH